MYMINEEKTPQCNECGKKLDCDDYKKDEKCIKYILLRIKEKNKLKK